MNRTFRLAFTSSMLGIGMMAGMIPGLGLVIGFIPDVLVWTVCGVRYFFMYAGLITLRAVIPQLVASLISSGETYDSISTAPPSALTDWLDRYLSTLAVWQIWILAGVVLAATFICLFVQLWVMVKIIRRFKRIKVVLVRIGVLSEDGRRLR